MDLSVREIKMKKYLLLTAACLSISLGSDDANALVVSDPGAYARMAQELTTLRDSFKVLQEQFQELQNIQASVSGNLERGKGIFRDIGRLRDMAEQMTRGVHSLPHMDLDDYDLRNIEDLQDALDKIYTNETDILKRGQTERQRKQYQQRSIRGALEGAEILINLQDERFRKIEELAAEMDETETLKDAMDLNNRLLGEILLVQQQALLLQSQYVRAEQSLRYEHADTSTDGSDPNKRDRKKSAIENAGDHFVDTIDRKLDDANFERPSFKR